MKHLFSTPIFYLFVVLTLLMIIRVFFLFDSSDMLMLCDVGCIFIPFFLVIWSFFGTATWEWAKSVKWSKSDEVEYRRTGT